MTVLIMVAMVSAVVVILVLRSRPEQRATSAEPSVSPETTDSSWSGAAVPVALGVAGDGDSDGRAGESGWGEHGAGGSWNEAGDGASDDGGGDSGGSDGGDGGSSD